MKLKIVNCVVLHSLLCFLIFQYSFSICVLLVSRPTFLLVTSPLNLLGSSLTPTCSVGVVAMLEPGIQVQVQWTDSSGGAVAGGTPAMGSGTSYTSQITLANTEESNVGWGQLHMYSQSGL